NRPPDSHRFIGAIFEDRAVCSRWSRISVILAVLRILFLGLVLGDEILQRSEETELLQSRRNASATTAMVPNPRKYITYSNRVAGTTAVISAGFPDTPPASIGFAICIPPFSSPIS